MQWEDCQLGPAAFMFGAQMDERPIGFVMLDDVRPEELQSPPILPPVPVIGIGAPSHPLASCCDAILEEGFTPDLLLRQVLARPRTAAIAMQLLRSMEAVPMQQALMIESIGYGLLQGSAEHAEWLVSRKAASEPSAPGQVQVERSGDLLSIRIDRPAARNAIDRPMRDALFDAFTLAQFDPEIARIRLQGAGKAFCVGADLDEFGTTQDPASAHLIRSATLPALAISRCADRLEVKVQGACIGAGVEMMAFAAKVTANKDSWFQLPELSMGVIPGAGGCVSLSRRIGRQRTALMLLSGRRINAATALEWGLVDALVDDAPGNEGGADIG